ncbi:ATP-binding protein [Streptomyces sp. NPDC050732]|uniref:ATP-binding protein n=1 Tax=Streptomyces sp. NPDC050732 TaxID=3154632 RepID=UPI003449A3EB
MGVPAHDLTSDGRQPEPPSPPETYTLFTPGNAHSAKICRDFVQRTLQTLGIGHLGDTAALCTSELVTNVHQHTKSDVHLRAAVAATHVRIAVYDDGDRLPTPRRPDAEEESGRGLFLVTALSDVCGVTPASAGKGVWFQLNR